MIEKITNYLKLLRVKHYIKNLLIFLPLLFGKMYYDVDNILICLIGFLTFSFTSSIIYIFNDICDIESDRKHEIKKNRPLASRKISIASAYKTIIILLVIVAFMTYLLYILNANMNSIFLVCSYVIINLLYSKWLKHIILVDVIILVLSFLIRVFFGAALIDVEVSNWLYLTIMSGAFYMGFGKRRNEIIKNESHKAQATQFYNKDFLDKNMYVCLALTVVFYAMWTVDPNVIAHVRYNYLIWTVPLVLIILFEYSFAIEKNVYGDPVDVLINNKNIILTTIIYMLCLLLMWL